jgi:SAM-dependent methyltransferase
MDRSRRDTRATYGEIAEHFAATRQTPWPEVSTFLEQAPRGRLGLDIGCANGRHFAGLGERTDRVCGVDLSRSLLEIAATDHSLDGACLLVQGEATALPLGTGCVDLALYIATLHHLPTSAARQASLAELDRVLATGGRALVSVWGVDHDRFDRERGFDTTVDWTLPDGETTARFYHIYDRDEFEATLDESPLSTLALDRSNGNYYATVTSGE